MAKDLFDNKVVFVTEEGKLVGPDHFNSGDEEEDDFDMDAWAESIGFDEEDIKELEGEEPEYKDWDASSFPD